MQPPPHYFWRKTKDVYNKKYIDIYSTSNKSCILYSNKIFKQQLNQKLENYKVWETTKLQRVKYQWNHNDKDCPPFLSLNGMVIKLQLQQWEKQLFAILKFKILDCMVKLQMTYLPLLWSQCNIFSLKWISSRQYNFTRFPGF